MTRHPRQPPDGPARRWVLWGAVLLVVVFAVGTLLQPDRGHRTAAPDLAAARATAAAYLAALEQEDRGALTALAPPGYANVDADITADLLRRGGVDARQARISLASNELSGPKLLTLGVTGTAHGGRTVSWTTNMLWIGQSWALLYGHAPFDHADQAPPSTSAVS